VPPPLSALSGVFYLSPVAHAFREYDLSPGHLQTQALEQSVCNLVFYLHDLHQCLENYPSSTAATSDASQTRHAYSTADNLMACSAVLWCYDASISKNVMCMCVSHKIKSAKEKSCPASRNMLRTARPTQISSLTNKLLMTALAHCFYPTTIAMCAAKFLNRQRRWTLGNVDGGNEQISLDKFLVHYFLTHEHWNCRCAHYQTQNHD